MHYEGLSCYAPLQIKLALQASPAPQGPSSSQQLDPSSAAQQAHVPSVGLQAGSQQQGAYAVPKSPTGPADSTSAPSQTYMAPSGTTQGSPQAPEQMAANLMQPSLKPTDVAGPLPEEGSATRAAAAPGDTVFDLAGFQVTSL